MKILVATELSRLGGTVQDGFAALRTAFPEVEFTPVANPPQEIAAAVDADAAIGRLSLDAFRAAKKLRWIQSYGAGVEWLGSMPEVVASDVTVTNTRGAHAATIADHTFGMLIYLTRNLGMIAEAQKQKRWARPIPNQRGLAGLTLGVIGLGNIGSAIAQRAHGHDMKVIAVDANDVPRADYIERFWLLDGLAELLRAADVVAVAAPLTAQSRGMLGEAQLALLKPTAYLVVVSRGGIVDQHALAAMLREGRLAGAGLDVTQPEPLPADSELWDTPNLVLTPHCSGSSAQTTANVNAIIRENIARFIAGRPLMNLVDKARGY